MSVLFTPTRLVFLMALTLIWTAPRAVLAGDATTLCTVILRASDAAQVHRDGDRCDIRYSPASTFKIALAVIGYDSALLETPESPAVAYDLSLNAYFEAWRETTTPQRWLRYSVIWYSQWLTTQLGATAFQKYVDTLSYGNRDLSGDPGKNNGLTRAWLGSSLKISPREQAAFLRALVTDTLPGSRRAQTLTKDTMQHFAAGPLDVTGKTGTAWVYDDAGARTPDQLGWFVGWASKNGETYVFARLRQETGPVHGFASSRTRASVLNDLPTLLP